MSPKLHILCTCRNIALIDATLLVFRTVRTGFPNALINVWGNGLEYFAESQVNAAAAAAECRYRRIPYRSHDAWIEQLLKEEQDPFWICDTDVVFFRKVEGWFDGLRMVEMAGRFEPEFDEEFTHSRHMARLHTALMYFNAPELRILIREWMARIPPPWGLTAQMNLVRQHFVPFRVGQVLFFDSTAGMYHAGLGIPFTPEQDAAFEHLHCGTYVDKIGKMPSLADLAKVHKMIYADPSKAAGLQKDQAHYYRRRRSDTLVIKDGAAFVTASRQCYRK